MVHVPAALWSYTKGASRIDVEGRTLADVVAALDARFPGLRFRIVDEQNQIRTHIRFFVNASAAQALTTRLDPKDEVTIICSLSGG